MCNVICDVINYIASRSAMRKIKYMYDQLVIKT